VKRSEVNFASIDAMKLNEFVRKSLCLPAKKLLYFFKKRKEIVYANGQYSKRNISEEIAFKVPDFEDNLVSRKFLIF
jgi:hypothetical protein